MRILQISDLHLSSNGDSKKNASTFTKLIDFIIENNKELNVSSVVVTGDITHSGERCCYELFFYEMERSGLQYAILGW